VIGAQAPEAGAWAEALARVSEIPGVEAESVSTPGALLGLGIRDLATAECGRCSRGLMPAPLWTVVADHHAVTPGYFDLAGIELLEGRRFDADAPTHEPVALVNLTFARTAFERGQPIGKSVRVGSGLGSWYRVIGVVADQRLPVLGDDGHPRSVVYLDARAHPPDAGSLVVRGSGTVADAAASLLEARGFAVGEPRTAARHRAEATAALRWTERISILIALLAVATAAHGLYLAALQTTRRRGRDLAVRRALGAGTGSIVAVVLGERLRVVGWGLCGFVFLGTLAIGLLRSAVGLPVPGPAAYLAIAVGVSLVGLAASGRAAREAIAVEPAALMD
jgi:putative ABC transport system permease protein